MIQTELYIREITRFLRTVTIKNVYFDEQMQNEWVKDQWRDKLPTNLRPYYRHLAGEYILKDYSGWVAAYRNANPSTDLDDATIIEFGKSCGLSTTVTIDGTVYNNVDIYTKFDEPVVILSIDTKTPVPFTKQVLNNKRHHKTAALYRIPNRYYSNVCEKYPYQIDLIKAIVYPIESISAAYKADNFSILACDQGLLEFNERTSLYACMEDTLVVIRRRWDVAEFTYEDLYALSIQAKIWSILLIALFKQRVLNIRTSAASKYHVWEYLKSKGLDDYRDVLSQKQAIFLYRNFPYLLRNRGTDANLVLLVHKLLSEWNIVIQSKNLLQQTNAVDQDGVHDTLETCLMHPVIDSVEIARSVLDELRSIDNNEESYVMKHMKSADELKAFDDLSNDLQELTLGTVQTLDEIYEHERKAGLEYQTDEMFELSKNKQTPMFTKTPHTYLPTKLLEITKSIGSTLFEQLYSRFVTETIYYRLYLGDLDYVITFMPEGSLYPMNLTIAQAIAMIQYCEMKETGTYKRGIYPPTKVQLTCPYKTEFEPIRETYNWRNLDQNTADALRIIPRQIELSDAGNLPISSRVFTLSNPNDYYIDWIWENEEGCSLTFVDSVASKYWLLSTPTWQLVTEVVVPYNGWLKWSPIWISDDRTYRTEFIVTEYEYVIDRHMPLPSKTMESLEEVMSLIHNQAVGYIQLYKELHGSDWSRQRTGLLQVVEDRTFKGVVDIVLLDDGAGTPITYDEFISSSPDISSVVSRIENMAEDNKPTEYAKLGNNILKTLFTNIDTSYLIDNAGVSANRFKKLKELFISLCSYNVAFLEGNVGAEDTSMTFPGFVTQDIFEVKHGITTSDYMCEVTSHGSFKHTLIEQFDQMSVNVSTGKEVMNTPIPIISDDASLVIPHRYTLCVDMHELNIVDRNVDVVKIQSTSNQ